MLIPGHTPRCAEKVAEGLDLAVQKMQAGERALITVQPAYGYGGAEHKAPLAIIPPGSTLLYDIVLTSFVNVSLLRTSAHDEIDDAVLVQ